MSTPPAVLVRPLGEDDLDAVCGIVNHFIVTSAVHFRTEPQQPHEWREQWRALRARYPWLVAVEAGAVVGVAYAGPWKDRRAYDWTAESTVYVAAGAHRRGVASALYGRLLAVLERQGFRSVVAVLGLPNEASVRLHERHGFVHTGRLAEAGFKHGRWHDVGFWQRTLSTGDGPPSPTLPTHDVLG